MQKSARDKRVVGLLLSLVWLTTYAAGDGTDTLPPYVTQRAYKSSYILCQNTVYVASGSNFNGSCSPQCLPGYSPIFQLAPIFSLAYTYENPSAEPLLGFAADNQSLTLVGSTSYTLSARMYRYTTSGYHTGSMTVQYAVYCNANN